MKQNNLFSHGRDDAIYNSEQLKLARLAAGKSLIEVGEALGVTRQYVHKLEVGATPSDEHIKTLANFLNVQESFFYKSRNRQIELEQCHFRSVRSSTQTLKKMVMSQVEILDTHFLKLLENEIDFPEIKIPEIADADISSVTQIELLAERVRRDLNIGLGPISNMTKLLEYIGCLVVNIKDVDERVDAFSIYNSRPLVIRNTAKISPCRLRFDLAHELGHLIMHQGIESGCRKTEEQANNFASAFLMPRSTFSTEFPKMRGRNFNWDALGELKIRWGVSYKAIIYRAAKLGLITQEKAKSGFTYLNRSGQSKSEDNDDKVVVENPSLVQTAINILDSYTWTKLLKESSINERILIDRYMLSLPKPRLSLV
ncbi:DNA-binding protein [Photobacterium leiognathi subsp. mandapamensis]|uniref:XRE family transcriptional regulator n=1 Tax=Photobacterium leiognathi TaxID=553611 RepID=UPI000D150F88|nr:XRE family transcriptional regulator [Photobacterium leiognathi]PSU97837.1 DNA-binding protein [Photobacterium leiognathi subsp. mandapamensis]